ncbi:MAG TPA: FlgD immunoglobulin-like domain containing protein [Bacteroidota bacterium]|nr:FlgD immunoglobulin-like domain containing protein [Bacteroidota bacterium]
MPVYQATGVGPPQVRNSRMGNVMDKDAFLMLLTNQLRFQDPMNPMKGTDFATQLAQFASVEQLNNISNSLTDSINANYVLTQAINNGLSAGFVGKEVRATGDTFNLGEPGEHVRTIKLGYTLPSAASSVVVKIKDQSGRVVRTLHVNGTAKGDNTFTWDGRTDPNIFPNNEAPAGTYSFVVEARDASNNTLTASLFMYGVVSAVRFTADGTKFVINGREVLLGNILEVLGG